MQAARHSRAGGDTRPKKSGTRAALIAWALLVGSMARSQPAPPTESPPQVFVHDSNEVTYQLALADRMSRLGQWDTAAGALQGIIDNHADRVVPVQKDSAGQATEYEGAAAAARQRLAGWPTAGLLVYRAKFTTPAEALLTSAGNDPAALRKVVEKYFITTTARHAGLRLIDQAVDAGRFTEAAWVAEKFLNAYPDLGPDRPAFLFRAGLANHLQAKDAPAQKYLTELRQQFPRSTGPINGKDTLLANALADLIKVAPPADQRPGDFWPEWGGDDQRDRIVCSAMVPAENPLLTIALAKPAYIPSFGESPADQAIRQQEDRAAGMWLNVWPIVDGECIFFQDRDAIRARDVETGLPPVGWTDYSTGAPGAAEGTTLALALSADSIFAISGQGRDEAESGMPGGMMGMLPAAPPPPPATRLISLNRQSGALRWSKGPEDVPDLGSLRALSFTSCPLVANGNVYILARGSRAGQFDDCYLLCFGAADGKCRWASFIASVSLGNMGFAQSSGSINNISHLSSLGGRIFVQSNVGAMAAVDGFSGNILWLNLYPRRNVQPAMIRRQMGGGTAQAKPWTFNAPLIAQGRVFALPSDAEDLLVYDAESGTEIQHLKLADFDQPDFLLAVIGDRLLFASDDKLWCVNWRTYDAEKFAAGDQSTIEWRQDFEEAPIMGRAMVTRNSVYVPTKRLYRIDMASGKIIDTFPPLSQAAISEGPGNILAITGELVLSGSDRINVYANPAPALAKIAALEKLHPTDAEILLRHAALIFAHGDVKAALQKLDELSTLSPTTQRAARGRAFALVMQWIRVTQSQNSPQLIPALLNRASTLTGSPQEKAGYCILSANDASSHHDWPTALAREQEILADPAVREVPILQPDGHTLSAGELAEQAISDLQRGAAEKFYAPYEQQALSALQRAQQGGDAGTLLAVAEQYPNSSVRDDALRDAAAAYLNAGDPSQCASVLHELLLKSSKPLDRPRMYQAIAEADTRTTSRLAEAAAWFQRAAKIPLAAPLQLPDGQTIENISSEQAAQELRTIDQHHADDARPEFHWDEPMNPLNHPGPKIAGVDALLQPTHADGPADRVITWSASAGVRLLAADTGQTLGQNSDFTAQPIAAAEWNDQILLADPQRLTLIARKDAHTIWRTDLDSLLPVDAVSGTAWEQKILVDQTQVPGGPQMQIPPILIGPRGGVIRFIPGGWGQAAPPAPVAAPRSIVTSIYIAGNRAIVITGDGRLIALRLSDGGAAWQVRLGMESIPRIELNQYFAVAQAGSETGSRLVVIDLFNGRIMRTILPEEGTPISNFCLSPDNRLILIVGGKICPVDLDNQDHVDVITQLLAGQIDHFGGMNQADQLQVSGQHVLAVSDAGAFVQNISLDKSEEAPVILGSGAVPGSVVHMNIAWPELYVTGINSLTACDMDHTAASYWTVPTDVQITDLLIGQNKLLVRAQDDRLLIYDRQMTPHGESGRLEFSGKLPMTAWQPTADGFCYLTRDHVLQLVHGE